MCQFCGLSFFGLAEPQAPMLHSYAEALRAGWSPSTVQDISAEHLAALEADAEGYLEDLSDAASLARQGEDMEMPDGTVRPRLARRIRWMWDGEFCGQINLRWQPGSDALPPYVSGHIGYSVVPWKRGHGFASRALRHMIEEARDVGLRRVELTTDPDNIASQKVIQRNRGVQCGRTVADGGAKLVWEIAIEPR